jgi:pyruvate formate lyase activating enzyme
MVRSAGKATGPTPHARGPFVVDIKRNSLDDGPGIRSVVFLKGCPLRCVWCQNPETLDARPEIQREPERCARCGACVEACEGGVARPATEPQARAGCQRCGACVDACPAAARRIAGTHYELAELVDILTRDAPFYRRSGGGVTLSGGEPTVYLRYAGELAAALRDRDVPVLLETCGLFGWSSFARQLLPYVSTIYFDLKIADGETHQRHTGRHNRRIVENLRQLAAAGFDDLLPRVPLIPGITDTEQNLAALADVLTELGLSRVMLLPYNPLWVSKRKALGLELPYDHGSWMSSAEVERCAEVFRRAGLTVIT